MNTHTILRRNQTLIQKKFSVRIPDGTEHAIKHAIEKVYNALHYPQKGINGGVSPKSTPVVTSPRYMDELEVGYGWKQHPNHHFKPSKRMECQSNTNNAILCTVYTKQKLESSVSHNPKKPQKRNEHTKIHMNPLSIQKNHKKKMNTPKFISIRYQCRSLLKISLIWSQATEFDQCRSLLTNFHRDKLETEINAQTK